MNCRCRSYCLFAHLMLSRCFWLPNSTGFLLTDYCCHSSVQSGDAMPANGPRYSRDQLLSLYTPAKPSHTVLQRLCVLGTVWSVSRRCGSVCLRRYRGHRAGRQRRVAPTLRPTGNGAFVSAPWFKHRSISCSRPRTLVDVCLSQSTYVTQVELAIANNIELPCLPAHTSNILQPLDVGVFKTVKAKWHTCLKTYYDETRYKNVDKTAFPCLLKRLINSGIFSNANAITAFQACGIYPVDRSKITADKLATSEPLVTGNGIPSSRENLAESTGSVSVPQMDAGLPLTTCSRSPAIPTILPSPSEDSLGVTVTPRKHIETTLSAHLRHVTPTDTGEKRKRIKQTLTKC